MSSYYARITQGMGRERLVAITGRVGNGLFRVIDVDQAGNPIGSASYVPANVAVQELVRGSQGFLEEAPQNETTEINWKAHESRTGANQESEEEGHAEVSSVSPTNPAMAAFPELQQ